MEQLEGYEKLGKNGERLVFKLNKSLYGLKQSGRNWNNMLHEFLLKESFIQSCATHVCTLEMYVETSVQL